MRWIATIVIATVLVPLGAGADTYVKQESHTDGYYAGGTSTPAVDDAVEFWIGESRLAYITDARKLIIDADNKTLTVVNNRDSSFVKTALPLDLSKLFSEEELGRMNQFKRHGSVSRAEASRKVGQWDCAGYDLSDWILFEGGRVSEREVRAWVTSDVPFDVAKVNAMLATMGRLSNLTDEYVDQLLAIQGFQVATEETTYNESIAVKTTNKVVEMAKKDPPPDAYGIPEGYTEKEILTLQELRD